jgi:Single-strand binding protein family
MYLNSVQIIGFIGKDPERRQARANNAAFTVLSVATQRSWKNADDEWASKTEWHRVVAWNSLGDPNLRDFKIASGPAKGERTPEPKQTGLGRAPETLTQSERDWAYAKRALARGDDPEEIIRRIADYRADEKHDPEYYARHTVAKAQAELQNRDTAHGSEVVEINHNARETP